MIKKLLTLFKKITLIRAYFGISTLHFYQSWVWRTEGNSRPWGGGLSGTVEVYEGLALLQIVYKSVPIIINIMNHPVRTGTAKCNMSQRRYQILAVLASCIFQLSFIISITIPFSPLYSVFLLCFLFILSLLSLLSPWFFSLVHRLGWLACIYDVLILSDKYGFPLPSAIPSRVWTVGWVDYVNTIREPTIWQMIFVR